MTIIDNVLRSVGLARSNPVLGFNDWMSYFNYGGVGYPTFPMLGPQTLVGSKQELPAGGFESYVQGIYKTNGIIFACMLTRMLLFSEARFQFRRRIGGRPGELFGTPALELLEHPWTNATTGDMLSRAIQDADLAGNCYLVARGNRLYRLRPDWVTIVVGSQSEPNDPYWAMDAEIVGYIHQPPGSGTSRDPDILLPSQVAHFAPIPDPAFRFRGMSWITPVLAEVMGDSAATTHKLKFFEQGATPNMIVSLDKSITKEFYDSFVTKMKEQHEGALNAYRTLYLGGGSTATVVGANMKQIDFKVTQGAGETRIAAAAGVPPVIVGLSEGLAASTYSNYAQARRRFADGTMRPLWRNMAGSLEHLIQLPSGAELWYDDRDISFLREDLKDEAEIRQVEATTIKTLIDAGYLPDTAKDAVVSGDFNRLKHSGLYSVQLQSPGSQKLPDKVPGETPATPIAGAAPQATLPAKATPPKEPARDAIQLTERENQIVELVGDGLTNKSIAVRISVSERTIERDLASAMTKSGVNSRTELAIWASGAATREVAIVREPVTTPIDPLQTFIDVQQRTADATLALANAVANPPKRIVVKEVEARDEHGRLQRIREETI